MQRFTDVTLDVSEEFHASVKHPRRTTCAPHAFMHLFDVAMERVLRVICIHTVLLPVPVVSRIFIFPSVHRGAAWNIN